MPSKLACAGVTTLGVTRLGRVLMRFSLVVVVLGVGERGMLAEACCDGLGFFCCVAVGEEVSSLPTNGNRHGSNTYM
jgi:hypothetical protein